jgi:hypothetical protein
MISFANSFVYLRVLRGSWRLKASTTKDTKYTTNEIPRSELLHETADIFLGRSAYGQAIDLDCRNTNASRYGLSVLQVPTPSSSFKSLPTIRTRVSTSGPFPIKVAPLIGAVIWPSSIR